MEMSYGNHHWEGNEQPSRSSSKSSDMRSEIIKLIQLFIHRGYYKEWPKGTSPRPPSASELINYAMNHNGDTLSHIKMALIGHPMEMLLKAEAIVHNEHRMVGFEHYRLKLGTTEEIMANRDRIEKEIEELIDEHVKEGWYENVKVNPPTVNQLINFVKQNKDNPNARFEMFALGHPMTMLLKAYSIVLSQKKPVGFEQYD